MLYRVALLLSLSLVARVGLADPGNDQHERRHPVAPGEAAPSFPALPVLNEKLAGTGKLGFDGHPAKGDRVWVLSFFATWCPGCVNEMPMLRKLNEDYRTKGVRVVSVSVDRAPNAEAQIKALLEKNKIRHPVLVDPEQQVLRLFQGGSTSLPYIFVIGPNGVVSDTHEGFDGNTDGALRDAIDRALASNVAQNK